ncbi:MAG: hypothetical protein P5681_07400 [Limnospira sp. PMC 894.15]|uniref:hypothetical protein n=1 Tax=Limnospira TaxID=2596745 RepID=UPI0028E0BC5F|nr:MULTISPECIES: hypothetical protein [unclassified Limnospira]MDT9187630.1 hypothetical protein [Limnospira sp. PMC 894.15]MDT9235872.1 hypothetical protein [Limnospira sp. PMC 917.15]MDY7054510.1 hypothetical protein [Limnospira fusiformis LS22]MDY7054527.1 hypothetical protein [Limnospira fusiformis LS22]
MVALTPRDGRRDRPLVMFGSDERSPNFTERKEVSGGSQKKTGFPNQKAIA